MLKYTLPAVPMTATTNATTRHLAAQLLGELPVLCSNEVESVISVQFFEADRKMGTEKKHESFPFAIERRRRKVTQSFCPHFSVNFELHRKQFCQPQ